MTATWPALEVDGHQSLCAEPDDAGPDEQLPPHRAVTSASGQSRGEAATEWPAPVARAEGGPGQDHEHRSSQARQRDDVLDDRIQEFPLQSDVEAQIRGLISARFHQVNGPRSPF